MKRILLIAGFVMFTTSACTESYNDKRNRIAWEIYGRCLSVAPARSYQWKECVRQEAIMKDEDPLSVFSRLGVGYYGQ